MLAALALGASPPATAQADPPGVVAYSCQPPSPGGFVVVSSNFESAQTFTPTRNGRLYGVEIGQLARNGDATGPGVSVQLLATSGGVPVRPALATATLPSSQINADNFFHDYDVNFDTNSAPKLQAGTTYAIALSTTSTVQHAWRTFGETCTGGAYLTATGGTFAKPSGQDLDLQLKVWTGPPNDNFADAIEITGQSPQIDGEVFGATNESGAEYMTEDLDNSWATNSVWYRWKAVGSGPTTMDTCTTDYDSFLVVFTGAALGSLDVVAAANNFCPTGFGSKVEFDAVEGETYRILVDGCCGAPQGTFTLKVNGQAAPVPPTPPVAADTTPPETTFAKAPKKNAKTKKRKARVPIALASSEPGSTFECSLDGAAFAPCAPSMKLKVKRGKHTFAARAIDAAGNVDATPAQAKFKVRRKKPRR